MLKFLVFCLVGGLTIAVNPLKYHNYKTLSHVPMGKLDEMYEVPEPSTLIDIFPPKNFPGEILKNTEHTKVDRALNEVMKSGDILHDRRCAIGIVNEGQALLNNPKWTMTSGTTAAAVPLEVAHGETSLNLFLKTKGAFRGTVGVLSYDIVGTNHKVVVHWHVPFDRNLYDVTFNMKVYERWVNTDKDLSRHLQDDGGPFTSDSWQTRMEYGVELRASMTDNIHSKLIIYVNADGFDPNGSYDLYKECSYHPGKLRYYCNQECYSSGWCWVDKRCDSDSDCVGRYKCNGGC